MKSFFDKIQDSTLTWNSDDDISISSSSLSSSDFDSSDEDDDEEDDQELEHHDNDDNDNNADRQQIQINDDRQEQQPLNNHHNHVEFQQQQQMQQGIHPQQPAVAPLDAEAAVVQEEREAQQEEIENELIFLPVHQLSELQRQAIAGAARHPPIRTSSTQILQRIQAHPRSNEFIMRIARCEILPLIRAEIDWKLLLTQLPTYPAQEVGDDLASFLLQSILRMTPTIPILEEIIEFYPRACVDMDPFYAACQFCNDEVVKFIIQKTISSRKEFGIKWSMIALLGDARISLKHARFLFEYKLQMFEKVEDRILDPQMGLFGVSPLDRMLSGQFIHGDTHEWVEKLKLALLAANTGNIIPNPKFYPFHALMKRLISIDFKGNHFGQLAFINCLNACIDGDEDGTPFHAVNEDWNLPLHTVLMTKCNTNLGVIGERKLVKFLLKANPDSATMKNSKGLMPIRLAIENGWPVYDIICHFCPASYTEGVIQTNILPSVKDVEQNATPSATTTSMSFLSPGGSTNNVIEEEKDLLIHDILNGPFSDRFGISGARELVRFVLKKYPSVGMAPDANGKLPIHIAIENGWPVHDLIVGAAPHTLEVKDPVTGLYPFLLAASITSKTTTTIDTKEEATASSNSEDEKGTSKSTLNADLSTLYELIREAPLMLQGFGTEHQKKNKAQMIRRRSSLLHCKRKRKHHHNRRRADSPTKKREIIKKDEKVRAAHETIPFPKNGIKLSYLLNEFVDECGGREALEGLTTTDVCDKIVKPLTKDYELSYCDMILEKAKESDISELNGTVETATFFISNAWKYKILDVIKGPELPYEWWATTFKDAIEHFGHTVMVMAPWNDPIHYKRAWCIFEAYCTSATNAKFEIAMSKNEHKAFVDECKHGPTHIINKMLSIVKAEKSEAWNPLDKERIHSVIRNEVGFEKINSMVFEQLRNWVLKAALAELNGVSMDTEDEVQLTYLVGAICEDQGKYEKADPLYKECLTKRKKILGSDHPDTLIMMSNLALLYQCQGKYDDAEISYNECLAKQKIILGPYHPHTLTSMNNLAGLYKSQGRYEEAEPLYKECLATQKIILEKDHPNTLKTMSNLAL